ncbi:aspartyl/asparaginyl beta-hydroxylase domain-containing protein [Bradyrhizobium sp. Tv2a-2]|uniref:aspartyl/asparaginyl beta-hydroxylase domain-containing protein n=1 Tax=Bradyrhizobium sp. Tv2a-2 TaxID=113395 RepID=UPI0004643D71|nr:aspartyl/asparaginyl beta-hydroxylase domain-containing protein [Bradyrhizobium sp. Tv2a-2]
MLKQLLAPQLVGVYILVASTLYVHFRGKERLRFARQLGDHSTYLAPYNVLMYAGSAVPNQPVIPVASFPELNKLSENWETIRDEAVRLFDEGFIRAAAKNNDWGFYSFFKSGWKRFYLKWYDDFLPSARTLCPKTVELLNSIPSVHGAMFAMLPPGGKLGAHRDPFAGSLRYHLGLVTPNSDKCRILVDGVPCVWRDGEAFMFDETFIHHAENATDVNRIILFCDVERPMRYGLLRHINRWVSHHIVKASATQNVEGEDVGVLNKVFGKLYEIHLQSRKVKEWNRSVYYTLKYTLTVAIIGLIVVSAFR